MTNQAELEAGAYLATLPVEGGTLPRSGWTFEMVEDRLVEAMITCWRGSDRETGWLRVKSNWSDALREVALGDYDARGGDASSSDVVLRPASQTRVEVAEMEEAFGWLAVVPEGDRRIVALAIGQLARGKRAVSWSAMKRKLRLTRGADGLRMRYGRAIAAIAGMKNGGNPPCEAVNPVKVQ